MRLEHLQGAKNLDYKAKLNVVSLRSKAGEDVESAEEPRPEQTAELTG